MEFSQFLSPGFLFSFFGGTIALVAWFVRLETKASNNKNTVERLQKEIEKLDKQIEEHKTNQDIHFNLRVSRQVENSNERRFATIEKQLEQINVKLDKMVQ